MRLLETHQLFNRTSNYRLGLSLRRDIAAYTIRTRADWAEAFLIFLRSQECADHSTEITAVVIEHVEPELIASSIRLTPQVIEVLRENEGRIELGLRESWISDELDDDAGTAIDLI